MGQATGMSQGQTAAGAGAFKVSKSVPMGVRGRDVAR